MKKRILTFFLVLIVGIGTMCASNTQVGGIWYNFDSSTKTASVTYRGSSYGAYSNEYSGTIVIPSIVTYNAVTYSVTSIGTSAFRQCSGLTSVTIGNGITSIADSAFYYCTSLTSIEIPNSVTSIGMYAFYYCTGLTSIEIPNSVTSIAGGAFSYCMSLTSVTIPNSVTEIGRYAFRGCSGLTSINVISDNSNYCSVDGVLFNKDKTTLIQYPGGKQGAYTIPNSVTSIAGGAFYYCMSLTSIEIPNSVTSIGGDAFRDCRGLTAVHISDLNAWCKIQFPQSYSSPLYYAHNLYLNGELVTDLVIPEGITTLGDRCFYGCTHLTSVTIPDGVTSIGANYFADCTGLASVTIGSGLTSMAKEVFMNCSALTSITCKAITPPTCSGDGSGVFSNVDKSIPLYVPEGSVKDYKAANQWKDFTNILPIPSVVIPKYTVLLFANNPSYGSVIGGGSFPQNATVTIAAIPNEGYRFVIWSDGNTENPRTFVVTQDTSLTALFELSTFGQCGETAYWQYNENKLYIYGEGDMYDYTAASTPWQPFKADIQSIEVTSTITSVGAYAFAGLSNRKFKEIFLPQGLLSIGKHAFDGDAYLETIDFGANVEMIGDSAFNGCSRVASMTCLAPSTPDVGADALTSISSYAELNVLASAIRKYQVDPNWSRFFIQEIGTNTTTVTNDDVTVEPQDNAATVTWPTNDNAATYTLQITKDGVVFCTLIFNANGQLTGIAFAPSRDGQAHAPQAVMTANGMQFTVTGLDSGTHYALTLQAKDNQESVLASYSSEFTTTGQNAPQGLDEISSSLQGGDRGRLILREGQVYILRGEKIYTVTGQEVK